MASLANFCLARLDVPLLLGIHQDYQSLQSLGTAALRNYLDRVEPLLKEL